MKYLLESRPNKTFRKSLPSPSINSSVQDTPKPLQPNNLDNSRNNNDELSIIKLWSSSVSLNMDEGFNLQSPAPFDIPLELPQPSAVMDISIPVEPVLAVEEHAIILPPVEPQVKRHQFALDGVIPNSQLNKSLTQQVINLQSSGQHRFRKNQFKKRENNVVVQSEQLEKTSISEVPVKDVKKRDILAEKVKRIKKDREAALEKVKQQKEAQQQREMREEEERNRKLEMEKSDLAEKDLCKTYVELGLIYNYIHSGSFHILTIEFSSNTKY